MTNPFEILETRLNNIETLLLDLKHNPKKTIEVATPDQLLTVEETAQFLNLSIPTVYSKVSKKELPVMKRSKRLYFSQAELTEYLKKGRRKTNLELEKEAEAYLKINKR